jgi:hypothetical protein
VLQALGTVPYSWETLVPPSTGFTNIGGIFTGPVGTVFPQQVTISGMLCGLVGSTYYGS